MLIHRSMKSLAQMKPTTIVRMKYDIFTEHALKKSTGLAEKQKIRNLPQYSNLRTCSLIVHNLLSA